MIKGRRKTETRRIWKTPKCKVGGTYACKTNYYQKRSDCPIILVLYMRQERLGDINDKGARKEGYLNVEDFKKAWIDINGIWEPDVVVTVVGFSYLEENDVSIDEWLDREMPDEFWTTAGHLKTQEDVLRRISEIPERIRPLASVIWKLATTKMFDRGRTCLEFRCLLFLAIKKLEDEGHGPYYLPYYWFMDGVMIEPEWIVRITNGVVGWTCDPPDAERCGLEGCCFRGKCNVDKGSE